MWPPVQQEPVSVIFVYVSIHLPVPILREMFCLKVLTHSGDISQIALLTSDVYTSWAPYPVLKTKCGMFENDAATEEKIQDDHFAGSTLDLHSLSVFVEFGSFLFFISKVMFRLVC